MEVLHVSCRGMGWRDGLADPRIPETTLGKVTHGEVPRPHALDTWNAKKDSRQAPCPIPHLLEENL